MYAEYVQRIARRDKTGMEMEGALGRLNRSPKCTGSTVIQQAPSWIDICEMVPILLQLGRDTGQRRHGRRSRAQGLRKDRGWGGRGGQSIKNKFMGRPQAGLKRR
jgi:hypothetical protein